MRTSWIACLVLVACSSQPEPSAKPAPPGSASRAEPPPPTSVAGPSARPATITTTIDLPQVARHGYVPLTGDTGVVISATPHGIVVEGHPIAAIINGQVDPAAKEGGSLGVKIEPLTVFMQDQLSAAAARGGADPRITLLVDKTLPYRLLVEIVFSTKQAGAKRFDFVAKHGEALVAVPMTLPVKAPAHAADDLGKQVKDAKLGREAGGAQRVGSAADIASDARLGMIVSITKTQIILWSVSGAEGTLTQPKLAVALASKTAFADLGKALAEIVGRRWPDGKRSLDARQIIVQADGGIRMQVIAEAFGAVRATPDDQELFSEILLSSGFE